LTKAENTVAVAVLSAAFDAKIWPISLVVASLIWSGTVGLQGSLVMARFTPAAPPVVDMADE
jgi:hypothetical protein